MPGYIDPTKETFAAFRANDRPGPIHMLNLVRLRDRAAYPDGREATGAEAYAAYGRESQPVFARLGGAVVWSGREKLHYLNPVPIHEIAERWIGKFERGRLRVLTELKNKLEGESDG